MNKKIAKAENKTKRTKASVAGFINSIKDPTQRADSKILVKLLAEASGEKPAMWGETGVGPSRKGAGPTGPSRGRAKLQQKFMRGPSIIGYGIYHYKYTSGREGDAGLTGFSPRKRQMTVYIVPGFQKYGVILKKLGKYKTSVSCLYFKKLSDIHLPTLKKLVSTSVRDMRKKYKV